MKVNTRWGGGWGIVRAGMKGEGMGDIDEVESGCEGGATWMMRVCIEKEWIFVGQLSFFLGRARQLGI